MRSPLLLLLTLPFELARADSGQCGALHTVDGVNALHGCWRQHYWDTFWEIRQDFCSKFVQAPPNEKFVWNWNKFEAQGQIALQPGMTNSRCWDAMWDIIWRCFDSANAGSVHDGSTHETGQWTTDVTEKEWYWLWGNTSGGWCSGCESGCQKKRSLSLQPMKKYSPAEWEATRQISAEEQAAIDAGLATDHKKRLGVASD
ncbi:hypothetical protein NQ176_g1662 [Zarea fungicola]|uniref:Uncharacterized protein n=1 Tax=Zarea fungicola TaxID=93591 RepID=A0ACC1NRV4_9HYPO|nr:hypothetical protein NQ176_g1662 [Lecanicillium fungicola]